MCYAKHGCSFFKCLKLGTPLSWGNLCGIPMHKPQLLGEIGCVVPQIHPLSTSSPNPSLHLFLGVPWNTI